MPIAIWLLFVVACDRSEPPQGQALGWVELDMSQSIAPAIAAQTRAAIAGGKKPQAYLHAAWCPPCVAIEKTRRDPRMLKAFAGTHIIAIDTDLEDGQLIPLGFDTMVLPVFFRLDADGHPTGDKLTGAAWTEDNPAHMAPALEAFFSR